MAQTFPTTFDNTQEEIATVTLTDPAGADVPVTGLLVQVDSGDGTFSMNDDAGNALPTNQIRIISGSGVGDTVYTVSVQNAVKAQVIQIIATILNGVLSVNVLFSAPTPKP